MTFAKKANTRPKLAGSNWWLYYQKKWGSAAFPAPDNSSTFKSGLALIRVNKNILGSLTSFKQVVKHVELKP